MSKAFKQRTFVHTLEFLRTFPIVKRTVIVLLCVLCVIQWPWLSAAYSNYK